MREAGINSAPVGTIALMRQAIRSFETNAHHREGLGIAGRRHDRGG
jgi:hypothetical protein